ncbi:MAG: tetratricopeptide repeat protein, partial [Mammaliicoccus vitulinus]
MYYYDGQYLKAMSNYETITQTGEDIINGISIYARMADASLQSGAYEEAINYYENVSEMDMTAEDYFKQAISYQKNDLTLEAIKQLEKLLEKDPDFMQAYHYLLQIFESEKNYEKAIEIGKEGLRLNAYYKELMTDMARLMLTTNDEHGAILLQDALTVDPSYTEAAIILADYYREKDNTTGLINLLTYVDHEDIDPIVAWHVGYAFGVEERDKEAQHFYELAYPDLLQNIDFLNDYYHYLIEIGNIETAKNILESVRKQDPENPYWDQEYERLL